MLVGVDKISPYERQLLLVFKQAVERSYDLDVGQKNYIEQKLQEIVSKWTNGK